MFQVRIHGRGGQGAVSGAEMLSVAAFLEDKHAQAFPSFGSERMGAPVVAFCRIDSKEIRLREPVLEPDALLVQDPSLFHSIDVFAGLKADGYLIVNTARSLEELGIEEAAAKLPPGHVWTVAATDLAVQHVGRPSPNAAMIAGLARASGELELESVLTAIRKKFPGKVGEANVVAAQAAFDEATAFSPAAAELSA
ncbi:MAG: 2-oxoacid:acceptor oxidoreductase family protein [Motiliproteus sp.]|nr:2-oxoacid:acceptor oxidoreductase family protein [Motiliproteus sp.]MCW9050726.1 2-oxoacid:acceptor oxidoreductase family protein [Motiliproteus sp.]